MSERATHYRWDDLPKEMVKPDSLDARLVPQMRAINVAMSKEQAAGGLIQVGDWVDMLLTSTVETGKDSSTTRTASWRYAAGRRLTSTRRVGCWRPASR